MAKSNGSSTSSTAKAVRTVIRVIITHVKPHLDEYAGEWFLRKFGERVFPGVSTAKIEYWNAGRSTPDGRSAEEWEAEGCLLLGVGGSRFDEHPDETGKRPSNECCTTLVVKALGLAESPVFQRFVDYVRANDVDGSSSYMDVARTIKELHKTHPPEKVRQFAFMVFEAFLGSEARFHGQTAMDYRKVARADTVTIDGVKLCVVSGKSDDPLFTKYARSAHGHNAAVVVQQRSSGQAIIMSDKRYGMSLRAVAAVIRYFEQRKAGKIVVKDKATLEQEGSIKGAENWHYDARIQCLLNGSDSAPDVPPTKLVLKEMVIAVTNNLVIGDQQTWAAAKAKLQAATKVAPSTPATAR